MPFSPTDLKRIRTELEERLSDIEKTMTALLHGELEQKERQAILHLFNKVMEKNQLTETDFRKGIRSTLEDGTNLSTEQFLESKTSGEGLEPLFIAVIHHHCISGVIDTEEILELNKETPDLKELNIDLKKSSGKNGFSVSTSSDKATAVQAMQKRLTGPEHDYLVFRFEEVEGRFECKVWFLKKEAIKDQDVYNRFKSAVLCLHQLKEKANDEIIEELHARFLSIYSQYLVLSRPKKDPMFHAVLDSVFSGSFGPFLLAKTNQTEERIIDYLRKNLDELGKRPKYCSENEYNLIFTSKKSHNKQIISDRFAFENDENWAFTMSQIQKMLHGETENEWYDSLFFQGIGIYGFHQSLVFWISPLVEKYVHRELSLEVGKVNALMREILSSEGGTSLSGAKLSTKSFELTLRMTKDGAEEEN